VVVGGALLLLLLVRVVVVMRRCCAFAPVACAAAAAAAADVLIAHRLVEVLYVRTRVPMVQCHGTRVWQYGTTAPLSADTADGWDFE
jgi:hypothetical protein